jgi:hypothetical protein
VGEAVSATRNRFDIGGLRAFVAEGFAEDRDVAGEADVFHNSVGPDQFHEFGFFHDAAAALEQDVQGVDGFWYQRHHFAVAEQEALFRVVLEWAEAVDHGA